MTKFPMTAAGYSALQDELSLRMAIERPRLIQRMQEAIADDSNLAENSEYHAAQADRLINEVRIVELEDKLARAEVIDVSKLSGDTIKFGATVTLINEDTDEKKVWLIVGEPEANANSGKISVNSPIARALKGPRAMPWRSWFQLVFGPTESKRWNGFDARTEACSHRSDGTRTHTAPLALGPSTRNASALACERRHSRESWCNTFLAQGDWKSL